MDVVNILSARDTLDTKYRDYNLSGNNEGTGKCHIALGGSLAYEIRNDILVLVLYRLRIIRKMILTNSILGH